MINSFWNEKWQEVTLKGKVRLRYAISTYGRYIAFKNDFRDGHFIKGSSISGYKIFIYKYRDKNGKLHATGELLHKLVARYFLPPKKDSHQYIIHLDYNKTNNHVKNLKWASKEEWMEHNKTNPSVIAGVEKMKTGKTSHKYKLSEAKVQILKQKIFDPNRKTRLRIIAKQFGITEMQLWRIQSGENWGRIQVKVNGKLMSRKGKAERTK